MIWEHINWMNLIHLTLTAQCQVLIKSVRQHRHRHRHVSLRPPIHNGLCSRFSTFNFLYRMRRLQPDANIRTKPFLRVAGKWKLCLSQLGFQLHFLKVWCQKKKGKKRNLTRYNLADCSYAHATNCCQLQLFYTVDFTLLIRMQNLFLNQNLCQDDNQFHKGRYTHTRASVLTPLCPSLNSLLLFSVISNQPNNEARQ